MSNTRPLPEYDAPPVDEVILGVEYAPIDGWKIPYAGLFWQRIRGDYPRCDVMPAVIQQKEHFPSNEPIQPSIRFSTDPNFIRCWFLSDAQTEIIQIQPDRFLRNWRHVTGDEAYPRYPKLRRDFERDWGRFASFLLDNALVVPIPIQCELTYINNIEQGAGWETFSDLPKVTPLWAGSNAGGFLPGPESAGLSLAYAMENEIGRLRISLNHAIRVRDGKEILQLQLTARGKPQGGDFMGWFDIGREWIVRAFTDVTTPEMHKIWRRRV